MTDTVDASPLSTKPVDPSQTPGGLTATELARWAWRQLTSMRTALVLLLMLMLAAVPGSLIPQERVDARAVANWKASHPTLGPIFEPLGLFQVYGSVWFSSIYILLMASLVGCIVPRLRVYWRALSAPPPRAPRHLTHFSGYTHGLLPVSPEAAAESASQMLGRKHYRVRVLMETDGVATVAAQRGYLREAGNLAFHISLIVVLVSFAVGNMFGFRGAVIVVDGQTFSNTQQSYDDFVPGALFRDNGLEPFEVTLDGFAADFVNAGPSLGQPLGFSADVTYRARPAASTQQQTLEVNRPLTIGGTSVFLVGNGYAPVITVRDGTGRKVYSGATVFLPEDASYASYGVVKVPDASPSQLGFEGQFLPTYGYSKQTGAVSQFPDTLAPALSLTGFSGNLGLDSGVPQSVYVLDKSRLVPLDGGSARSQPFTLAMGETRKLPDGLGSIRFDGIRRWARLQVSSTPAEPFALAGVVLGLLGLLASLYIRPRRIWLRARPTPSGCRVELAGLDRVESHGLDREVTRLMADLQERTDD